MAIDIKKKIKENKMLSDMLESLTETERDEVNRNIEPILETLQKTMDVFSKRIVDDDNYISDIEKAFERYILEREDG